MRLTRLAVRGYRKLLGGVDIDGIEPSLTVIVGDNEEGKSTLLKALQSALFDRHNVTGKLVHDMMPFGSSVRPEIEVDFDLDGTGYSLKKCFGQGSSARLISDGKMWQDDSVEETLRALFGFTPPGRGAAKDEHRGLAGLLWVEQGRAPAPLALSDESRSALQEAIEGEVGQVLGGERGRRLLAAVGKRADKYYTPTGREREPLKSPRQATEEREQEHDTLQSKITDYNEKVNKLGRLQERLRDYERNDLLGAAKSDLDTANAAVKKIEAIENRVEVARAKVSSAEDHALAAEAERDRRKDLAKAAQDAMREAEAAASEFRQREPEWEGSIRDLYAL